MTKTNPDSFYKRKIKKHLPQELSLWLTYLKKWVNKQLRTSWRVSFPVTKILGRQYKRSNLFMEIDLTYACNLSCNHCNRSCPQAPSDERLTLDQIKKMLAESIKNEKRWQRMRLLGGEPTMNQDIIAIVQAIYEYKQNFSPAMQIILVTNGISKESREIAEKLKTNFQVTIEDSSKQPQRQLDFVAFNQAPKDDKKFKNSDYSNGCHILRDCGLGFTPYGFYPCAIAGGIDRVLGQDIARKSLPQDDDQMLDQLNNLCAWCGHFKTNYGSAVDASYSDSWRCAYEDFKNKKPSLSKY